MYLAETSGKITAIYFQVRGSLRGKLSLFSLFILLVCIAEKASSGLVTKIQNSTQKYPCADRVLQEEGTCPKGLPRTDSKLQKHLHVHGLGCGCECVCSAPTPVLYTPSRVCLGCLAGTSGSRSCGGMQIMTELGNKIFRQLEMPQRSSSAEAISWDCGGGRSYSKVSSS